LAEVKMVKMCTGPVQALCTNLVQMCTGAIKRCVCNDTSLGPEFPGGREQVTGYGFMIGVRVREESLKHKSG